MESTFEKNFNRRNFIAMTTKILAATATFGLLPNFAEASHKDKSKKSKKTELENEIVEVQEFELPKLEYLTPFDEIDIGSYDLEFKDDMDVREGTGAIVIHHAGLTKDMDIDVPAIHDMHLGNGWSGIGYHFVIHKDGTIEEGRPLKYQGAHSYKNNQFTVGICMTGNYNIGYPPLEQALAVQQLTAALCQKFDIEPADYTIFGHRDLNDTSCPGENFYPHLPQLIENVKGVL